MAGKHTQDVREQNVKKNLYKFKIQGKNKTVKQSKNGKHINAHNERAHNKRDRNNISGTSQKL